MQIEYGAISALVRRNVKALYDLKRADLEAEEKAQADLIIAFYASGLTLNKFADSLARQNSATKEAMRMMLRRALDSTNLPRPRDLEEALQRFCAQNQSFFDQHGG